jgi:DNA-binding response OmpR family regulator
MFTGTGNEELAVRAIKHGFDDYVVKGSRQLRRLATAVRSAYDRNNRLRELGENRELVLKELYHRLHNNLQLVISLLRMTEKTLESESDRRQLADLGADPGSERPPGTVLPLGRLPARELQQLPRAVGPKPP